MNMNQTSNPSPPGPETPQSHDYFAKGRFQREEEARARRATQGAGGQRRVEWALEQIAELAGGGSLFDLACGNGRHFQGLCRVGATVMAGDYSEAMLGAARALTPAGRSVPLVRLDAERLPFADKAFDGIFCARFFHHVPKREIRERILSEVFRTSRKAAVVTYKARFSWEHLLFILKSWVRSKRGSSYRYFMPLSEFDAIAQRNGWKVTRRFAGRGGFSSNRVVVMEPLTTRR